jgi:4-amino-4-deoxy-L-arabinose transferase-like glycosyltransferase
MRRFQQFLKNNNLKYIFKLFLVTRFALGMIGVFARSVLQGRFSYNPAWVFSKITFFDVWGHWDTGWYMDIAANWYPSMAVFTPNIQTPYAFFPLYPFLMRILGYVFGDNYFSALLVSNIALIIAAMFLYKLVKKESDKETANRAVLFLFLFPTSFILSGGFTESLFLALTIVCFYYAMLRKWFATGIFGFFLVFTRPLGILIIVPLLFEYFKSVDFNLKKALRGTGHFLGFMPLSLLLWSVYCHFKTNDMFAFLHAGRAWGHGLANPLSFFSAMTSSDIGIMLGAFFGFFCLIVMIFAFRKINLSHWLAGVLLLIVPIIMKGDVHFSKLSIARFVLVVFPLYIILARASKNEYFYLTLMIFFSIIQGFLMFFWSNGFYLII